MGITSIGCNPVIVRNVFTKLSKASLLKPGMGKARTRLGRPADKITLYDVFAAVDADDADGIFRMYTANTHCPVGNEIHDLLSSRFDIAIRSMMNQLSKTTIADLVSELPQEKRCLPEVLRQ